MDPVAKYYNQNGGGSASCFADGGISHIEKRSAPHIHINTQMTVSIYSMCVCMCVSVQVYFCICTVLRKRLRPPFDLSF